MNLIETLGLIVVALQVVVADRPRRRDSAVMLQDAEILPAKAEERCAIEFRVAANIVVSVRMERLAFLVVPVFFGLVLAFEVDHRRIPVCFLARNKVAALQNQNPFSRRGKPICQRASSGAAANDNDVVLITAHRMFPFIPQKMQSSFGE